MPKIALQFYGLVRGFRFSQTRDRIHRRIIAPLEKQGFEVHTFFHTYDIEFDDVVYKLDPAKFNVIKVQVDSDAKIQDYLENTYKLTDKYEFPSAAGRGREWTKKEKYGWFKFYNSIRKVTRLRKAYAKENDIEYTWVIVTSPQMEPQNDLDDLTQLDNNFMYSPGYAFFGGYYASFYLGSPKHINYVAKIYNYMIKKSFKAKSHKDITLIEAEPILKQYIDYKYVMKPDLDVRFHRVRFNGDVIDH